MHALGDLMTLVGPFRLRPSCLAALLLACPMLATASTEAQECIEHRAKATDGDEFLSAVPTFGTRNRVAEAQVFGVAGTQTLRRVGQQSATDGSVLASGSHFIYDSRGIFSGRSIGFGFIGGGSAGFEGGLGGELALGVRFPFSSVQGPIARIAIDGFLLGNDSFFSSQFQLPKGEAGYQVLTREVLFELAATAGPIFDGRYNVDTAPDRRLGGLFQFGGYTAFGFRGAHLELALDQIRSDENAVGTLTRVTSSLCGMPSLVAICLDAHYYADQPKEPAVDTRVAYLGLRMGAVTSTMEFHGHRPKRALH